MTINLQNLIHLTTPQYLIIAIINPIVAYMLITQQFPSFEVVPIILSFCFAVLGFNTFNQISDIEIDKIDKPLRPLISKKMYINEALVLSIIFYLLSLIISISVNVNFLVLMVVFFLITFGYCHEKIYLKKYFWGSPFVGTILYGLLPFLAILIITNKHFNFLLMFFIIALAAIISNTKDFEDLPGEKKFGIKSLQTLLGFDRAAQFIVFSEGLLLVLMGCLAFYNYIPYKFIYAAAISLLLFAVISYLFLRELRFVRYKHIAFSHTNDIEIKKTITQSEAATIGLLLGIVIEIIFGLIAVASF